jgi:NADP-dependent 3-hydroxy acid dehydrogenase YdfG
VHFPRVLHEGVARLLAADLVGEKPVRESMTMLRRELDELDALVDNAGSDGTRTLDLRRDRQASMKRSREWISMTTSLQRGFKWTTAGGVRRRKAAVEGGALLLLGRLDRT